MINGSYADSKYPNPRLEMMEILVRVGEANRQRPIHHILICLGHPRQGTFAETSIYCRAFLTISTRCMCFT